MAPSARRQNFSAEPAASGRTGSTRLRNASLAGSKCERLTAATRSPAGQGRVWIRVGPPQRLAHREMQPLGAMAGHAAPDQAQRRRGNHADDRRTAAHQRNIHRVFEPSRQELERCHRADRPAGTHPAANGRAIAPRLPPKSPEAGRRLGQTVHDRRMRGFVGAGNRGIIGLEACRPRRGSPPPRISAEARTAISVKRSASRESAALSSLVPGTIVPEPRIGRRFRCGVSPRDPVHSAPALRSQFNSLASRFAPGFCDWHPIGTAGSANLPGSVLIPCRWHPLGRFR